MMPGAEDGMTPAQFWSGMGGDENDCYIEETYEGDPNQKEKVQAVRDYRDNTLSVSLVGRAVIRLYYTPLVKYLLFTITNKLPGVNRPIKAGLDSLVKRIRTKKDQSSLINQETQLLSDFYSLDKA